MPKNQVNDDGGKILQMENDLRNVQRALVRLTDTLCIVIDHKLKHIENMEKLIKVLENYPKIAAILDEVSDDHVRPTDNESLH